MEKAKRERPEFCSDEHLEYLDELRESGETNMWGAGAYLRAEFEDMTRDQATKILLYWMDSFSERHPS
jgi:hypothetical protein